MVGLPGGAYAPFWDPARLRANDAAFTAPTAAGLAELRDRYAVRWLVLDREVGTEPPALADLADLRFRNDRVSVYRLRQSGRAPTARVRKGKRPPLASVRPSAHRSR
jgi:hypothetical protein